MILFPLIMRRLFLLSVLAISAVSGGPEESEGVKYASDCEVCKVVARELETRLDETGKTHDVLELGYSLDDVTPKKKKEYKKSELRLVESLENVCDRILEYNIHKEREDSTRFSKGMSQTFKTLHGLVYGNFELKDALYHLPCGTRRVAKIQCRFRDKGVKVELGIPYELWDKPSVEITTLKTQCEDLLENYESDIEEWYHKYQGTVPLIKHLCSDRALKGNDASCLKEKGDKGTSETPKSKRKTKSKESKKKSQKNPKNSKQEL